MKNKWIDFSLFGKTVEIMAKHGWKFLIVYFVYKIFSSMDMITILI